MVEKQARVILTDRWYNTCDAHAAMQSPFHFELDVRDIGTEFVRINIDYIPNKVPLSSRLEMRPSSSSEWHFLAPQDYPISFCNASLTATTKDFTSSF
jgi:hypothetical protein